MRYAICAAGLVVCATFWFGGAWEGDDYPAFTEADIAGFIRERQQQYPAARGRPTAMNETTAVATEPPAMTITALAIRPAPVPPASMPRSARYVPRPSRD